MEFIYKVVDPNTITMENVKKRLLQMTKAKHMKIMLGTGTLANESIALQLNLLQGRGLILTNGEDGKCLITYASRAGLSFDTYEKEMGVPFLYDEVEEIIKNTVYEWIWFVHHETSTGMLNHLDKMVSISNTYKIKLCVDCMNSIGVLPICLKDVYFASGVSGKTIGPYTGLSFLFYNHTIKPNKALTEYMDIGMYELSNSTLDSNTWDAIHALKEALKTFENEQVYQKIRETYEFVEREIINIGLQIVIPREHASAIMITIALPKWLSSKMVRDALALQGFIVHYEASFLQKNNRIQIACLHQYKERDLKSMLNCLQMYIVGKANLCRWLKSPV